MSTDTSDFTAFSGVYIAVPCYGMQLHYQCAASIMRETDLMNRNGYRNMVEFLGNESHIDRGRMYLSAVFLGATDLSHLMFIDSDIEFDPGSVMRLMAHMSHNNIGIVAGLYPKKDYPISYVVNMTENGERLETFDGGELIQCDDVGTGFMCIHRNVFLAMEKHYPDCHVEPSDEQTEPLPEEVRESVKAHYTELFHSDFFRSNKTGKRRFKSEDYAFCRRWSQMGGKIFFDPTIRLNHVGAHKFAGDTEELGRQLKEMINV